MVAKPAAKAEDIFGGEAPPVAPVAAPTSITETPEFRAAVAAAAAEIKREITEALKDGGGGALATTSALGGESAVDLFRQMALSIAEMNHQGDKRDRPVDPRIMAERAAAQARLDALVAETRQRVHEVRGQSYRSEEEREAAVRAVSPKYRAIAKVHFGDRVINPFRRNDATKRAEPIEFYWLQEPNDALRPLNDLARRIFMEFRLSRGNRTAIEKASVKPAWMTDSGLIIEGDKIPVRRGVETERSARDDDLDIPTYHDPEAPFVHVLGTISEPAMQNFQGKPI